MIVGSHPVSIWTIRCTGVQIEISIKYFIWDLIFKILLKICGNNFFLLILIYLNN